MRKILIIDDMHDSISQMLLGIGWEAHYRPEIQRTEILQIIHQYDGLMVRSKTAIDKELLERADNLKIIARAGAGLDQISVEEIEKRKIKVINAPEGNRDAVGEHTLGLLLTLFNKINTADQEIRNFLWKREPNRGLEVMGKTVGLFGYGNMGESFAKRLSSLGCTVIAYDKYKEDFNETYAKRVSEDVLKEKSDIVSLHVPLTSETRNYFNSDYIKTFTKDIFILNTARGEILPLKDLIQLIKSGKVKGAALDVLENEKFEKFTPEQKETFEQLIEMKNVILSPHVAGWSVESFLRINEVLVEKLKRLDV